MDDNKKINKLNFENADVWLSISIGTCIAIGMGAGIALGIALNSLIIGIIMGCLFSVLVGMAGLKKKPKKAKKR